MAGRPARLTQGEIASELSGSQKGLSFQDAVPGELRQVGHLDASWPRKAAGALLSRRRPDSGGRRAHSCPWLWDEEREWPKEEKEVTQERTLRAPLASGPCQWCWGGHRPLHTETKPEPCIARRSAPRPSSVG